MCYRISGAGSVPLVAGVPLVSSGGFATEEDNGRSRKQRSWDRITDGSGADLLAVV